MSMKAALMKIKVGGALEDFLAVASYDTVLKYNAEGVAEKTLATEIATILSDIAARPTSTNVTAEIKEATDELYNKILGLTDSETTINEAYDTLKEVADYLTEHGDVVAGITSDIAALKTALGSVDAETGEGTGVLKEIYDVKARVSTNESAIAALTSRVTTLETSATTVEASDNNGYIKVNGEDVKVYENPGVNTFYASTDEEATTASAKMANGDVLFQTVETSALVSTAE